MTNEEIIEYIKKRIGLTQSNIDMYEDDEESISTYDEEVIMRYIYVRNELEHILSYIEHRNDSKKLEKLSK